MWKRWRQRIKEWWLDRPHEPGTVVKNRYTVTRMLGMGSYGISYLVFDRMQNEERVLKQVRPSRLNSPKGRPLYEYEIELLATLRHPQMPYLFDAFEENEQLYYVMSYIKGSTLEDMLFQQDASFTEPEAWRVILQILTLVKYLHSRRIIHRDVRIPNVIWNDGTVYLLDFGLARYVDDSPSFLQDTDNHYWLEKKLKREVHPRSDMYALGHFLLFMLYSTYEADEDEPERGWERELSLAPETVRMLRRMLQFDQPYETADELEKDILTFLQSYEKENSQKT
ncbi:serine/threonine protein kinase [Aneurinibacillus migulanus]|uniref:serine/threonine protein kinase n=1 Tax=Aneurinibacillus migulanus TaxID=47500 RepID=UPI00209E0B1D|nr:serine/threonine-protein kinase [Aneurinibacillus migulanus]MCP1354112.1 serine/threonine protein kinase [Aneurinibacillus migulanus]